MPTTIILQHQQTLSTSINSWLQKKLKRNSHESLFHVSRALLVVCPPHRVHENSFHLLLKLCGNEKCFYWKRNFLINGSSERKPKSALEHGDSFEEFLLLLDKCEQNYSTYIHMYIWENSLWPIVKLSP